MWPLPAGLSPAALPSANHAERACLGGHRDNGEIGAPGHDQAHRGFRRGEQSNGSGNFPPNNIHVNQQC